MLLLVCHVCACAIANADTSAMSEDQRARFNEWSEDVGMVVLTDTEPFWPNGWRYCRACDDITESGYRYEYAPEPPADDDAPEPPADDDAPEPTAVPHVDYPHEPGYLFDCPACESSCHCSAGKAECVFDGNHNGAADDNDDAHNDSCVGEHCSTCGVCTMRNQGDECDDCRDLTFYDEDGQCSEDCSQPYGHPGVHDGAVILTKRSAWPYSREDIGMDDYRADGPVELNVMHPYHRDALNAMKARFETNRTRLWAMCMYARAYGSETIGELLMIALHRLEDLVDFESRDVNAVRDVLGVVEALARNVRDGLMVNGEPAMITDDGMPVVAMTGSGNGWLTVTVRLIDGTLATENRRASALVIVS